MWKYLPLTMYKSIVYTHSSVVFFTIVGLWLKNVRVIPSDMLIAFKKKIGPIKLTGAIIQLILDILKNLTYNFNE